MSDIIFFGRYTGSESLGGSEKFMKRIFKFSDLSDLNLWFTDFYFGYKAGNLLKKIFGKEILEKGKRNYFLKLGIFRILSLTKRKKVRIFILNGLEGYAIMILLLVRMIKKIKVIYILHGLYRYELKYDKLDIEPIFYRFKYITMEKIILKLADVLCLFTDSSVTQLRDYYGFIPGKIIKIRNGVDEEYFYRKKIFNYNKPLKIIYSGGYGRAIKGFDFMIRTLSNIDFEIELFICGNISDNNLLEKNLRHLSRKVQIHNKGFLDVKSLADLYRNCDIHLLPSRFETFGIAAAEAAASSLVPILTQSSGISEYLVNRIDCLKFDYDDSETLLQHLRYLNFNRNELEKIGKNAHKKMMDFTWEIVSREFFTRIKELTG
ncbi:MAG: hypothetical protein Kow0098_18690 [Ignavibacteriaceae bacterium]